ncbi:MAG: hypothetical protein ACI9TH_002351 [Kiritimatiellia bacterium]|jgi:hypothetical protein
MKHLFLFSILFALMTNAMGAQADSPYRHVVLFKFKDDAPADKVVEVEKAFMALKGKIPLIQQVEWGKNVSPEGLDNGFTHCFFVTFKNKADLEKYLPHPEHQAFVELLKPQLDRVLVVDYVARAD